MSSKLSENDRDDSSGDSYNVHLLRDIKEISRALYLHKTPLKVSIASSEIRSKSVGKTRVSDSRQNPTQRTSDDNSSLQKNKKPLLAWNWKKPLRAISHFRQHRFDVCFHLHVHSIEGLPPNFDNSRLVVQWKRKDEVSSTQPCIVLDGTAEFDETLMHRCWVYGNKSKPHHSAKYEVKLFLIYASVMDNPQLDLGKHWIDLTRLLPLSLNELEGKRITSKWSTSFKLSGVASGAVLTVSFDYSVLSDSYNDSNATSESNNRDLMLLRLLDEGKASQQVSSFLSLDFSKSIDVLSEKLNEKNTQSSEGRDIARIDFGLENTEQTDEFSDTEFSFFEKGIEMFEEEGSKLEESTVPNTDSSRIEIIDVDEILKEEDDTLVDETRFVDQLSMAEQENGAMSFSSKQSFFRDSESFDLDTSSAMDDSLEQENLFDVKSNYKAMKLSKKSLSLDDITESVANDFLNMLDLEDCSYVYTSDDEPASPRECLLKEFEKGALASENFFLDFNGETEYAQEINEEYKDFSFTSSAEDMEEIKCKSKTQLLINRRKAKVLEDLETETLMREWGLNENIFRNSPRVCSEGFGSPIELPAENKLELPPLGDDLGPYVKTKGGGYIRSMNPLLFRQLKNDARLIMQVSAPVVLASEFGSDIIEILRNMAASGIEGLCSQVNAVMALEDITGKTIHEVAEDMMMSERSDSFLPSVSSGQLLMNYASLEEIVPLAMDTIESLSIEGLRIQCCMSEQDAPSSIEPKLIESSDALELTGCCLTLDEWLKLEDETSEKMMKILSMRNELTLALTVLLRDPLRNYERVGATMLALIRVERPYEPDMIVWRISEISVAGLKTEACVDQPWGTRTQQQSGTRWLLASGNGTSVKFRSSQSKAIVVSNPQAGRKHRDALWSITADSRNQETEIMRNPDVVFAIERTSRYSMVSFT